jgi:hypothetical protein
MFSALHFSSKKNNDKGHKEPGFKASSLEFTQSVLVYLVKNDRIYKCGGYLFLPLSQFWFILRGRVL